MKRFIVVGFLFICVTRSLSAVFLSALLKFSPILLISLSPFLHHLILTSSLIPGPLFLTIGIIVSIIQCAFGFEFGRLFLGKAMELCLRYKLISQEKLQKITLWLGKSAAAVLFLIPGPYTAMVAGTLGAEKKLFYFVMIIAQIFWVCLCFILGTELESYFLGVKTFLVSNWIPVTIGFILLGLGVKLRTR